MLNFLWAFAFAQGRASFLQGSSAFVWLTFTLLLGLGSNITGLSPKPSSISTLACQSWAVLLLMLPSLPEYISSTVFMTLLYNYLLMYPSLPVDWVPCSQRPLCSLLKLQESRLSSRTRTVLKSRVCQALEGHDSDLIFFLPGQSGFLAVKNKTHLCWFKYTGT